MSKAKDTKLKSVVSKKVHDELVRTHGDLLRHADEQSDLIERLRQQRDRAMGRHQDLQAVMDAKNAHIRQLEEQS